MVPSDTTSVAPETVVKVVDELNDNVLVPHDCSPDESSSSQPKKPDEELYHSPQEVLQRKRESLQRENENQHTYYNERLVNQPDNRQVIQDIGGRFHVTGAEYADTEECIQENKDEHDYYNVVNPNYRAEPIYN